MAERVRVLAAARHPAAGEALSSVVTRLREESHALTLLGVDNNRGQTRNAGGAAAIFDRLEIPYKVPESLGFSGDPLDVDTNWAEHLIHQNRPGVLLVGASYDPSGRHFGVEDALLLAAEGLGLPSLQVVDTIGTWFPRVRGGTPDRHAVENEFARRVLVARGAAAERIVITGQPAFDDLVNTLCVTSDSDFRESHGLGTHRLVAFFTQGDPDNKVVLSWLIDELSAGDRLVVARHPRDEEVYSDLLDGREMVVDLPFSSHALLDVIDLCVTRYSMMGFKAALRGIPTINVLPEVDWADVRRILGGFPLSLAGGSVEAHSRHGLRRALASPQVPDVDRLKSWFMVDGGSTDRVVREVLAIGRAEYHRSGQRPGRRGRG